MRVLILTALLFLGACKSETRYDPEKDNIDYVELKRRVDNVLAEIDSGKWGSDYNVKMYLKRDVLNSYERILLDPKDIAAIRESSYRIINFFDCHGVIATGNKSFSMNFNNGLAPAYISDTLIWKNKVEQGERVFLEKRIYLDRNKGEGINYNSERISDIEALFSLDYICGFEVENKKEVLERNLKFLSRNEILKFIDKYKLKKSEFLNDLQNYADGKFNNDSYIKYSEFISSRIQSREY